ncbi:hypothetical protein Ddc_16719 [Ditylenchus destructor]|nr:hypothetical protein Ddc_16719 [Ditylenchus destructor]
MMKGLTWKDPSEQHHSAFVVFLVEEIIDYFNKKDQNEPDNYYERYLSIIVRTVYNFHRRFMLAVFFSLSKTVLILPIS